MPTNLVFNPTFSVNTDGWAAAASATIARITTDTYLGRGALQVTRSATTACGVITSSAALFGVSNGSSYTASAYVKVPTGESSIIADIVISYYNSSKVLQSTVTSTDVSLSSSDGWTRLSLTFTVASASIVYAAIAIVDKTSSPVSGDTFLVDAVMVSPGSLLTQFIEPELPQAVKNQAANIALTKLPQPHLTGMKLRSDVRINGLTLNTVDENDIVWVCRDIEGWWNLSNVDTPDIARGLDDGSYDVRGRRTARSLTIEGSILVPDPSFTAYARQKLMEAFNLVYEGAWLYVDESPTKVAYVRLVGQPTMSNTNARGRIEFSIPLRAGDPIKYDWNENNADGYTVVNISSASNLAITNSGNTDVAAVYTLTGPITAPAYIVSTSGNTTQTITVTTNLRDTTASSSISASEFSAGVATLTTSAANSFMVGDRVVVDASNNYYDGTVTLTAVTSSSVSYANPIANVTSITHASNRADVITATAHGLTSGTTFYIGGSSNPVLDGAYTVLASPTPTSTTFSYTKTTSNQTTGYGGTMSRQISYSSGTTGTVTLAQVDTLEIDTYNKTVLYRGLPDNSRSTIAVNVDWIQLAPGENLHTFSKTSGAGSAEVKYRSGWIG
jgi:hypothetical protein